MATAKMHKIRQYHNNNKLFDFITIGILYFKKLILIFNDLLIEAEMSQKTYGSYDINGFIENSILIVSLLK